MSEQTQERAQSVSRTEVGKCLHKRFPERQNGVVAKSLDSGARGKGFMFWLCVHMGRLLNYSAPQFTSL